MLGVFNRPFQMHQTLFHRCVDQLEVLNKLNVLGHNSIKETKAKISIGRYKARVANAPKAVAVSKCGLIRAEFMGTEVATRECSKPERRIVRILVIERG
jgi:hypothetical protein